MSTITTDTLLQIENIIKSAKLVEITDMAIEQNSVRGINKSKTAFMISDLELPDDFETIGINRPDVYLSRFNMIKDLDFKASTKVKASDKGEDFVEQVDFKSKSIKSQYRCCDPNNIQCPRTINDIDTYTIKFDQNEVDMLVKACSSMDTENISLIGSNEGLAYTLTDLSSDTIDIQSDIQIEAEDDTFNFRFNFIQKSFLALIKNCDSFEFILGKRGVLKIKVNNIIFYLMPQA